MTPARFLHPVEHAIAASPIALRAGRVVAAVSGGADSMALIEELRAWNRKIVVAHFDHRLRDDSERDARHVEAYARAHGFEFVLGVWRGRTRRASVEEAARDARNGFLASIAEHWGACVATAHTQSDQVETVLMRILRGTGRAGLAGIPARRDPFLRPLLGVTRADTRDYCGARGVDFVDDPSNDDLRFFRNRIRHQILPELRASYPSIDEALLRLADRARCEQRAFRARAPEPRDLLHNEEPNVWALRLDAFDWLDDDDARSLLRDTFAHAGFARDVGRVHYERLLELVRSPKAGASADLPGVRARREHDALVLYGAVSPRPPAGVAGEAAAPSGRAVAGDGTRPAELLKVPGRTPVGDWIIDVDFVDASVARHEFASAARDAAVAYFDAGAVATPLRARPPRAGDRMRPFGLAGHKKLSDLFVDRKVPRRRREHAIVVEGDVIHWVPGVAASEDGRIGPTTVRVLRLKATHA